MSKSKSQFGRPYFKTLESTYLDKFCNKKNTYFNTQTEKLCDCNPKYI